MKNQPTSVIFPSESGPGPREIWRQNGGEGTHQRKKQGNHNLVTRVTGKMILKYE